MQNLPFPTFIQRKHSILATNVYQATPKVIFIAYMAFRIKTYYYYYYFSLQILARYVLLALVGLGYKIEVFTHNKILPDNY